MLDKRFDTGTDITTPAGELAKASGSQFGTGTPVVLEKFVPAREGLCAAATLSTDHTRFRMYLADSLAALIGVASEPSLICVVFSAPRG